MEIKSLKELYAYYEKLIEEGANTKHLHYFLEEDAGEYWLVLTYPNADYRSRIRIKIKEST